MNGVRRDLFTEFVDHNFQPVTHQTAPITGSINSSSNSSSSSRKPLATADQLNNVLQSRDLVKIKLFVRENNWSVEHEARKTLWTDLSKARHHISGDIYDDLIRNDGDGEFPPFVDSKFVINYNLNSAGVAALKRILSALHQADPAIVYCPALYPTTAVLLHYMNENDCFDCLYAMVRDSTKTGYLAQTKAAYAVSGYVLKDLAKKYAKPTWAIISKTYSTTDNVFTEWLKWIFHHFPFAYLVRIMDCYLVEGIKIFYRVALSMMLLFHKLSGDADMMAFCGCLELKSSPQKSIAEHIQTALNQFSEDMPVPVERLLKTAFNIRGFQRKDITKLELRNEMVLTSLRHVADSAKTASCGSLDHHMGESGAGVELCRLDGGSNIIGNHEFTSHTRQRSMGDLTSVSINSSILPNKVAFQTIWQWLPLRMTVYQPELLFTTDEHGTSLRTMYLKCEGREIAPTIMLIKTQDGDIFGAYCSADWIERKQHKKALTYFGTGESFVFTVKPHVKRYEWVGIGKTSSAEIPKNSHMFQAASDNQLTIGGGDGEAIRLDEEVREGLTEHCATFNNEPLGRKKHFMCTTLEVIGFK